MAGKVSRIRITKKTFTLLDPPRKVSYFDVEWFDGADHFTPFPTRAEAAAYVNSVLWPQRTPDCRSIN